MQRKRFFEAADSVGGQDSSRGSSIDVVHGLEHSSTGKLVEKPVSDSVFEYWFLEGSWSYPRWKNDCKEYRDVTSFYIGRPSPSSHATRTSCKPDCSRRNKCSSSDAITSSCTDRRILPKDKLPWRISKCGKWSPKRTARESTFPCQARKPFFRGNSSLRFVVGVRL